jgi:hypothetical protein
LEGLATFGTLRNHKETHITTLNQRIDQIKFLNGSNGTLLVCCALLAEFNDDRKIIDHVINLDDDDRNETYRTTWNRCVVSSWNDLERNCATTELSFGKPEKSVEQIQ